jgi:hypothetical protein
MDSPSREAMESKLRIGGANGHETEDEENLTLSRIANRSEDGYQPQIDSPSPG